MNVSDEAQLIRRHEHDADASTGLMYEAKVRMAKKKDANIFRYEILSCTRLWVKRQAIRAVADGDRSQFNFASRAFHQRVLLDVT